MKLLTHNVTLQSSHPNFQKKFCLTKKASILNFRILAKIAYILKTVLDRGISMKFLIHREFLKSSHLNFLKKFVSPKMAAILKNAYILKTMLDRAISLKCLTHRVSSQ